MRRIVNRDEGFDPFKSLLKADHYFGNISGNSQADLALSDVGGLVNFICVEEKMQGEDIIEQIGLIKPDLIALTGIATAYMNKKSQLNPEIMFDINTWWSVISHLPLLSCGNIEQILYNKRIRGIEIATELLGLIIDRVDKKSLELEKFKNYLQNQGDIIRKSFEEGQESYRICCLNILLETVPFTTEFEIVPKVQVFQVKFYRNQSNITASCASHSKIDVSFSYAQITSIFDYQSLNGDPVIREDFNRFIREHQREAIKDSSNFFEGIFEKA